MEPSLSFAFSQPNLILAWTTNASAFALLQAPDLDSSTKWTPVTNDITVSGASNTVSIDTSNGNQFYRLSAP